MDFITKKLRIGGMTCISCQRNIERALRLTDGVLTARVSFEAGLAEITYDPSVISLKELVSVIEGLDYQVLEGRESRWQRFSRTAGLLILILSLYLLLQHFGVLNFLVPSTLAETQMGYGALFLVGLLTSVHCISMCGGINLSQCLPAKERRSEGSHTFLPALSYNLGRVISYTAIGFLLGAAGALAGGGDGFGLSFFLQGIIKIAAGLFMVVMGINMLGLFPGLRRLRLSLPGPLSSRIEAQKLKETRPLVVGLLNGLMPCGPLQSMQIVALASGSPIAGALSMLFFSLGTVPLMLGLGAFVSLLGKKFSRQVLNAGAVLVTVLGLAMISQGGSLSGLLMPDKLLILLLFLSLAGIFSVFPFQNPAHREAAVLVAALLFVWAGMGGISFSSAAALGDAPSSSNAAAGATSGTASGDASASGDVSDIVSRGASGTPQSSGGNGGAAADQGAEADGVVQTVESTLTPGRYPNITVQAGIPVKWIIHAPAGSINGCNYKLLLSAYGIVHQFTEGDNVIEFTPTETGTVRYSCWMGMIYGNIFVTDAPADGSSNGGTASSSAGGSSSNGSDSPADNSAGNDSANSSSSGTASPDVPVPSGYQIPAEELAIAQLTTDEQSGEIQKVTIELTDDGFSPAVVVVQPDLPVLWQINNSRSDAAQGIKLLAPVYATSLDLQPGENLLTLYPQDSFEVSTGDHQAYAYVKVVPDLGQIDKEAIEKEVEEFEPLIYPDIIFETPKMDCCS